MTTIATFREFIKPYCHQCPNSVLDGQILETLIDFCKETLILKLDATAISILEDTAEYTPAFSAGSYKALKIIHALLGDGTDDDTPISVTSEWFLDQTGPYWKRQTTSGNFSDVFLTMEGKVRVFPVPDADLTDSLYLKLAVMPKNDATLIDDLIYNDHRKAIRAGVLSELLAQTGRIWANQKEAETQSFKYEKLKADAKGLSRQGNGNISMVAGYSGSTMF
jgi:hypothetical protein